MENKKLYICGSEFGQANYKKTYTSVEKLKLDNLSWNELGIYEIKVLKTNCIEEPSLFNVDIDDQINTKEDSESEITQNSVNTFFGKISQIKQSIS